MEYGPFYVRGNADYTKVSTGPKITSTQTATLIQDVEPEGRLHKGARDTWDSNYNVATNPHASLLFRNGFCYVRCLPAYSNGTMPRGYVGRIVAEIRDSAGALLETRALIVREAGIPLTIGGNIRVAARQGDRRRWIRGWAGSNPRTATAKTQVCTFISPGLEVRNGTSRTVLAVGASISPSRLEWYRTGSEPPGHNGYIEVTISDGATTTVERCDFYTVAERELDADKDARAWGYNADETKPISNFHWASYGGDWVDGGGQWYGSMGFANATASRGQHRELRFDVTALVRQYGAGFRFNRYDGTYNPYMAKTSDLLYLEVDKGGTVTRLPLLYSANTAGTDTKYYNATHLAFEQGADAAITRATLVTHHNSGSGSGSCRIAVVAPIWRMPVGVPLEMMKPVDRVTPLSQRSDVLLVLDTDQKWKKLDTIGAMSGHIKGDTTHHIEHGAYYAAQLNSDTLWHIEVFLKDKWGLPDGLEACRIGYFSYIHDNYRRFPGETEPADLGGKDIGVRGFGEDRDGKNAPVGSGGRIATGMNGWSQRTGQVNHAQHAYPEWHLAKRGLGHDGYSYHMDGQNTNGVSHIHDSAAWHPYGRWVWIEKQFILNTCLPTGPFRDGHTSISIDEHELYMDNGSTWREQAVFPNGDTNGVDSVQMNCYLGGTYVYDPQHKWPRAMAHFVITKGTDPIGDPRLHRQGLVMPPPPNELGLPDASGTVSLTPARGQHAHSGGLAAVTGIALFSGEGLLAPERAAHSHRVTDALLTGSVLSTGSSAVEPVRATHVQIARSASLASAATSDLAAGFFDAFSGPATETLKQRGYMTRGLYASDAESGLALNGLGQTRCTVSNPVIAMREVGGADHYAQARLWGTSSSSIQAGVIVRARDYKNLVMLVTAGPGQLRLLKRVGSTTSTTVASFSHPWVPGDLFRLEVEGTTLRPYVNGVQLGAAAGYPLTDAVFAGVTRAGVWARGLLDPAHDELTLALLQANELLLSNGPRSNQVVQREAGRASATLRLEASFTGTTPALIQRRLETAAGTLVPGHDWADVPGATVGAGVVTGLLVEVPEDGLGTGYVLKLRTLDATGAVLSQTQTAIFTVGAVLYCDGGVNAEGMFAAPGGSIGYDGRNAFFDGASWTQPPNQEGAGALASALSAYLGVPIGLTHTALGGTAIAAHAPGGSNWQAALDRLTEMGGCEIFCWIGGEADIGSTQGYVASFAAIVDGVRAAAGRSASDLLVAVGITGPDSASADDAGYQELRRITAELPNSVANCMVAFDAVTLSPAGALVRDVEGYTEQARRLARSIAHSYGKSPHDGRGPRPVTVHREGDRVSVSFDLNGSSTLTGSAPLTGWEYSRDGITWESARDAAVEGPNSVRFTGAGATYARHLYGAAPDVSNVVRGDLKAASTSAWPLSAEPTRISLEIAVVPTLEADRAALAQRAGQPSLEAAVPVAELVPASARHEHRAVLATLQAAAPHSGIPPSHATHAHRASEATLEAVGPEADIASASGSHAHRAGQPVLSPALLAFVVLPRLAVHSLRVSEWKLGASEPGGLAPQSARHTHRLGASDIVVTAAVLKPAACFHTGSAQSSRLGVSAHGVSSLAEVKAYLRLDSSDEDPMLESLVRTARGLCEAFTGQLLLVREVEEVVAINGDWRRLKQAPVVRVSRVEIVAGEEHQEPLAPGLYDVSIEADGSGRVRIPSGIADRARVTYRAGLAETWDGVPEPLRHGITRLVAHMYAHRDDAADEGPPAMVAALWRPWRRMRLA